MITMDYQYVRRLVEQLAIQLKHEQIDSVYGIPYGGTIPASMFALIRNVPMLTDSEDITPNTLVLDDISDSGKTMDRYRYCMKRAVLIMKTKKKNDSRDNAVWFVEQVPANEWVEFPWEKQEDKTAGVHDNIRRILQFIGEDTNRDGLLETPSRVARSYSELFAGYKMNQKVILSKTFDSEYDQMVVLKNIEFYSMCEHHMLPFFGKVSIAYIPKGKVVGISKLARLVEMYSRRLQIQEQLTEQIADAIVKELNPKGVGVTIEAQHFCMVARGVSKQNSSMVTSKLRGAMMTEPEARAEYYKLISEI